MLRLNNYWIIYVKNKTMFGEKDITVHLATIQLLFVHKPPFMNDGTTIWCCDKVNLSLINATLKAYRK